MDTEEKVSGEGLAQESQASEGNAQESQSTTDESQEEFVFNAEAFNEFETPNTIKEENPSEKSSETTEASSQQPDNQGDTSDSSEEFTWDSADKLIENEQKENQSSNDSNADSVNDNQDNAPSVEVNYGEFFKEVGIEAKTKEEFIETYNSMREEVEFLKKSYPEKNEKIESFENLIKLEDKKLVERSLKADGFEGVELENALERLFDNDMIDIEAKKIRNTLNKAIASEREAVIESKRSEIAKQEQERLQSIKDLESYLNSTEKMFGFKMASTPEKTNEIRKAHKEYIVSGKFLQDITQSEKDLADCAWLWKNKDVILKAMQTKGFNSGRKDVLDQIGNPDVDAGSRTFVDPRGNGEFDPSKFMGM